MMGSQVFTKLLEGLKGQVVGQSLGISAEQHVTPEQHGTEPYRNCYHWATTGVMLTRVWSSPLTVQQPMNITKLDNGHSDQQFRNQGLVMKLPLYPLITNSQKTRK